jgi:hypothetical protein
LPGWVTLKVFPNEPAALIAQAMLEGGGVHSVVRGEPAGGVYPGLQFITGMRLLVAEADVAAAVELLVDDPDEENGARP